MGPATRLLAVLALCLPVAAMAAEIDVPSGQTVTLYDVVLEPDDDRARFLFFAPAIGGDGGGMTFAEVEADFPWLCEQVILPALAANDWTAVQVILSMSSVEVPFGERDPEAVQFFEAFTVEGEACVVEVF